MRYAKKREDDSMDWNLDEERTRERLVRVRRREAPMSPRVTRKMAKVEADLVALAKREDPRASMAPTVPRPGARAAAVPPPLPIPFPFPFANTASTSMPSVAVMSSIMPVHDSWLVPGPLPTKMPPLPKGAATLSIGPAFGPGSLGLGALNLGSMAKAATLADLLPSISPRPLVGAGTYLSLFPREPEPFTVAPPAFSLPPR